MEGYKCEYYLRVDFNNTETQVTKEAFIRAEKNAGFRSKSGHGIATGGFGSNGIEGRVEYIRDNLFINLNIDNTRHNNRFKYGWKLICKINKEQPHCLTRGCGKETLSYWCVEVNKTRESASFLRWVLNKACDYEWAVKSQSDTGHSIFKILKG